MIIRNEQHISTSLVPDGSYQAIVTACHDKVFTSGRALIEVEWQITEGQCKDTTLHQQFWFEQDPSTADELNDKDGRVNNALRALILSLSPTEAQQLDTENLIHKKGVIKVTRYTGKDGQPKNRIVEAHGPSATPPLKEAKPAREVMYSNDRIPL